MIDILNSINWLDLIQLLAVLFGVYIAYEALNTWKHQSKAQKQTDFLDELTDAVHDYIESMSQPIEFLKFIYINFESYKNLPGETSHEHSNIISYITARGESDAKKLWEYLNNINHFVAKIRALVARGQVYGFNDFDACINSTNMLIWQHQRLQVVASIIGMPTMNWNNPDVIKGIENMLTVKPDDLENHIVEENVKYLAFVKENYQRIYKGA